MTDDFMKVLPGEWKLAATEPVSFMRIDPAIREQLDRIEAMLIELTSLPHNKRPTEREVYLNDQISQDNEAMLRAHGWVKND